MKNNVLMNYFEIMNDSNNPLSEYLKLIYVKTNYQCEKNEINTHLKDVYEMFKKLQEEDRLNELSIELLNHILTLNDYKSWKTLIMLDIYLNPKDYYLDIGDEYYNQILDYIIAYLDKPDIKFIQNPFINTFSLIKDHFDLLNKSHFYRLLCSKIIGFYWLNHDVYDFSILVNIINYVCNNSESFYQHCVLNGFFDRKYYISTQRDKEIDFIEELFKNGEEYGKRR